MLVRPSGFAWKEGELRLVASPTSSDACSACPARCVAWLEGFYKAPGVLGRLNNPPAPFLTPLESLLLPPMPQPFCAAQACDGRKELLGVLVKDDFLPSHASVAVLVGRGCGRGWA